MEIKYFNHKKTLGIQTVKNTVNLWGLYNQQLVAYGYNFCRVLCWSCQSSLSLPPNNLGPWLVRKTCSLSLKNKTYHPEAEPKISCCVADDFPTSPITLSIRLWASIETSLIVNSGLSSSFDDLDFLLKGDVIFYCYRNPMVTTNQSVTHKL